MRYLVEKGYGFIRRGITGRVETKAAHQLVNLRLPLATILNDIDIDMYFESMLVAAIHYSFPNA